MTNEKPSEQALLAEYEVCQREASDCVHASWQSGIVLFVTTLTLAGTVIYGFLNTDVSTYRLMIVMVLGVFSIALLYVWVRYLTRQHLIRRIMFYRMEKIEKELNLRKSSYVRFVDHATEENWGDWKNGKWFPFKEAERKQLWEKYNKESGRGPQGYTLTTVMAWFAITAWGIFMLSEILIYNCPVIRYWFLN
jgi:Ca2+/Na+ antiporter